MAWFRRKDKNIAELGKKNIPSGLWTKCPTCTEIQYKPELDKNYSVCRHCGHHFRVSPAIYRELLLDQGSFQELFGTVKSADPLKFKSGKNIQISWKLLCPKLAKMMPLTAIPERLMVNASFLVL